MPFVSEAQRRKFYATPSLHKYIPEFEAATPKSARLPERVSKGRTVAQSNFDRLASKLAQRGNVSNPRALAAYIGRKKYGPSTRARASARGVPASSIAKRPR